MTYNEWRDELKSNLLCVSEAERRRVLDYYAEAYADRREAGFSEREIIDDFGAPYDAAQRILSDNSGGGFYGEAEDNNRRKPRGERERRRENEYCPPPPPPPPQPQAAPAYAGNAPACAPPAAAKSARPDCTWVFVLLCVIFAVPLLCLITGMIIITVGFCVAPIATIGSGAVVIINSLIIMIGGDVAYGFFALGSGIIIIGVGVILCPLFFKLVALMWKLFHKLFSWLKSLFSGKERA